MSTTATAGIHAGRAALVEACTRAVDIDDEQRCEAGDLPCSQDVLCVDVHVTRRILLGYGGPTRYVDVRCSEDGAILDGVYVDTAEEIPGEVWSTSSDLTGEECETIAAAFGCYWDGIDG